MSQVAKPPPPIAWFQALLVCAVAGCGPADSVGGITSPTGSKTSALEFTPGPNEATNDWEAELAATSVQGPGEVISGRQPQRLQSMHEAARRSRQEEGASRYASVYADARRSSRVNHRFQWAQMLARPLDQMDAEWSISKAPMGYLQWGNMLLRLDGDIDASTAKRVLDAWNQPRTAITIGTQALVADLYSDAVAEASGQVIPEYGSVNVSREGGAAGWIVEAIVSRSNDPDMKFVRISFTADPEAM